MTEQEAKRHKRTFHIVIYDDSADFGGHQAVLIEIVRALAEECAADVTVLYCATNHVMRDLLAEAASRATLVAVSTCSRRLDNLSPFLRPREILRMRRLFVALRPDLIVVSQGRIELSVVGLLAARLTGSPVVSYIPMAHPLTQISRRWHARVREVVNRILYRLPHRYVTISSGAAANLRMRSGRKVDVLENCVDPDRLLLPPRDEARRRLGILPSAYVLTVLGRLDLGQKGQDVAIRAVAALAQRDDDIRLVLAGNGPDRDRLGVLASELGIAPSVLFLPWSADVANLYAATDVLLIPSRYEGVPLVMIEAMLAGIPMVAAGVDGMADYLPKEWLVPPDDSAALAAAVQHLRDAPLAAAIAALRDRAEIEFSPALFRRHAVGFFTEPKNEPDRAAADSDALDQSLKPPLAVLDVAER